MNMYTVIVIVALASTAVLGHGHKAHHEAFKKNVTECKATVKATDDDVKLVLKHATPSSKTGQCLVACILKKKGWMDQKKINADATKQALEHMKGGMKDKVTKCNTQGKSETDECAIASKFTECLFPIREMRGPMGEALKNTTEKCKASVKVTEDEVKLVKVHEIPSTKSGQCLMACIQKKIGLMNANNTINKAAATKLFEGMKDKKKEKYEKIIKQLDTCKAAEKPETDECLAAKKFAECMHPPKKE